MNRTTPESRRRLARGTGRERPDQGLPPRRRANARGAGGEVGAAQFARPLPASRGTDRTIEVWRKQPVGSDVRKITQTRGERELLNTPNPLDVKSWSHGPPATLTLDHPKAGNDVAIYGEKPTGGHPGGDYALRSVTVTKDDGPDLVSRRTDFQWEWDERFAPPADAQRCTNK